MVPEHCFLSQITETESGLPGSVPHLPTYNIKNNIPAANPSSQFHLELPWLTHPWADLNCPLSKNNLVSKSDPQEDGWE